MGNGYLWCRGAIGESVGTSLKEVVMTQPALAAQSQRPDVTQYAALSFSARYRGDTLRAYTQDLRAFLRWRAEHAVEPLQAQRPHLELYLRWMGTAGPGFRHHRPALHDRRGLLPLRRHRRALREGPVVGGDSAPRAVGGTAPPRAARRSSTRRCSPPPAATVPGSHALVAPLGMIGLRVSEATNSNVTDLRSQSEYELLTIAGKGAKPALIPLPVPVLPAVPDAADGRGAGPLLLNTRASTLLDSRIPASSIRVRHLAGSDRSRDRTLSELHHFQQSTYSVGAARLLRRGPIRHALHALS